MLRQQGRVPTDSALALAAGLHRADIHHIQEQWRQGAGLVQNEVISLSQQVLANWVLAGLPGSIPFKVHAASLDEAPDSTAQARSFTDLVNLTPKASSHGFSPRLVLQDMMGQGLLTESRGQVSLRAFGSEGVDSPGQDQAVRHLAAAGHDLLATGLHNLQAPEQERFLEQSLEVDGLFPASVQTFHLQAEAQWQQMLSRLVPTATALSEQDEPQGGSMRLRLGIYFYAEPQTPTKPNK